ncbi:MAG: hypothetical protein V4461_14470 [Pseudomonadota bacterium]
MPYTFPMRLTFTKRSGKYDDLHIARDGSVETVACPKQGIIPHDMVHYAVESILAHRGFLTLVAEGQTAGPRMVLSGDSEEAIERLVETFQAEMWGGRVSADDVLATFRHACAARGHGAIPVSPDDIAAIRARIDTLTEEWTQLPVNGALTFSF